MASPAESPTRRGVDGQEVLVTLLLVLAALATSWSSYQATRWHGEQAATANRTSAIRIDAARAASLAEAQTEIDVSTFIAWVDADQAGDDALAAFYVERFRPEFGEAFEAWLATRPLTDPTAPPTPFAMPDYQLAAADEASTLDRAAAASADEVSMHIQRASNYVLTVVLYAVVLFFAGMSGKLNGRRGRQVMVALGSVVLLGTIGWAATFPVSVAV
jgi:hypothetical protein